VRLKELVSWLKRGQNVPFSKNVPLFLPRYRGNSLKAVKDVGPPENTAAHKDLEFTRGFSYGTLLGELMYVYITCRPDIRYAITSLSKFFSAPAVFHYKLLQGVAK
jgi:hypothetical protein